MKYIKTFESFRQSSTRHFVEKYEVVINYIEDKLKSQGLDIDPPNFWSTLQDFNIENKFDDDLEAMAEKWYGVDYKRGEDEYSDEYFKISKKVDAVAGRYNTRRKFALDDELLKNSFRIHWKEAKEFYQRWIDFLKSKRGTIAGKKYSI